MNEYKNDPRLDDRTIFIDDDKLENASEAAGEIKIVEPYDVSEIKKGLFNKEIHWQKKTLMNIGKQSFIDLLKIANPQLLHHRVIATLNKLGVSKEHALLFDSDPGSKTNALLLMAKNGNAVVVGSGRDAYQVVESDKTMVVNAGLIIGFGGIACKLEETTDGYTLKIINVIDVPRR